MRRASFFAGALVALLSATAGAEPVVLRMGTVAPEGTSWARELKAVSRDVAGQTHGALEVKWYFGGIAGDDVQAADRIARHQLDGLASGGMMCERVSPLMRAAHVVTLTRPESYYVINRLSSQIREEFVRAGYVFLGSGSLGPDVLFTREPVRDLADLKRVRLWIWDLDDAIRMQMPELGLKSVPMPINDAARAYDRGKIDGFVALPGAALAFQWSAQARYLSNLRMGFVSGCVLLSRPVYDALPLESRQALEAAVAKMQARFEDLEQQQDAALLGGVFEHQGLHAIPVSAAFQEAYTKAARAAQKRLGEKLVPKAQLDRVIEVLDELHHQHGRGATN